VLSPASKAYKGDSTNLGEADDAMVERKYGRRVMELMLPPVLPRIYIPPSADDVRQPLLERPWAEREFILVVDDQDVIPFRTTPGGWTPFDFILGTERKGIGLLAVGRSEAARLKFPDSTHPQDRVVYVGHPFVPERYYPAATFHTHLFADKFDEAVRLLTALHASTIRVTASRGLSRDMEATIAFPTGLKNVVATGTAERHEFDGFYTLFEATFKAQGKVRLHEHQNWYPFEPQWQRIADGRLNGGLKTVVLDVRHEQDFGVKASFSITIQRAGLEIGGGFQRLEATVWKIVATFDDATLPQIVDPSFDNPVGNLADIGAEARTRITAKPSEESKTPDE
jgi:hypothetical protein